MIYFKIKFICKIRGKNEFFIGIYAGKLKLQLTKS